MTTIEALLAMDSLEQLPLKLEARRGNATYLDKLLGERWVQPGVIPHGYPIFSAPTRTERDLKLLVLAAAGIEARPYFACLPLDTWVRRFVLHPKPLPISEHRAEVGYYLPIHEGVTREDCERMAEIVRA